MIGTFAVCYFPTFISALPAPSLGPNHVPRALQSILSLLVTINGALNPVIYVLRSNEFNDDEFDDGMNTNSRGFDWFF